MTQNKEKKSITFLMPGSGIKPSGGYKVVYEYATRLVKDGYDVHIVYGATSSWGDLNLQKKARAILRLVYWKWKKSIQKPWFALDKRVNLHNVMTPSYSLVPKTDYYVATAVDTAYVVKRYPVDDNNKLYLIQDFENWGVSDKYVYESYRLGLKNIVISDWLAKEVERAGANYVIIKNGFDFDYFKLTKPVEERNPFCISMLYHNDPRKGCNYGLEALKMVREEYPNLTAKLFGVPPKPHDLPQWIEYYQIPDRDTHNQIYNESAIYLAPSLQEGWGLTVGEAMICGCAIVCTNTLGFQEMVTNGKNGIICNSKDSMALAKAIKNYIEDSKLRIAYAKEGIQTMNKFTWTGSYNRFIALLS